MQLHGGRRVDESQETQFWLVEKHLQRHHDVIVQMAGALFGVLVTDVFSFVVYGEFRLSYLHCMSRTLGMRIGGAARAVSTHAGRTHM